MVDTDIANFLIDSKIQLSFANSIPFHVGMDIVNSWITLCIFLHSTLVVDIFARSGNPSGRLYFAGDPMLDTNLNVIAVPALVTDLNFPSDSPVLWCLLTEFDSPPGIPGPVAEEYPLGCMLLLPLSFMIKMENNNKKKPRSLTSERIIHRMQGRAMI